MINAILRRNLWTVAGALCLAWSAAGCDSPGPGPDPAALASEQEALFGLGGGIDDLTGCNPRTAMPWEEMTPLQRHVSYFDWDGDGTITVQEDYRGFRAMGTPPLVAAAAALAINAALGTPTSLYPTLTIDIAGIDRGIHGSDTGVYDDFGNFDEEKFDSLFKQWDRNGDNALDIGELTRRTIRQIDLFDFVGPIASVGEFGFLFYLAADREGKLGRDRLRQQYVGTLFYRLAWERGALGCRSLPPGA